MQEKTIFKWRPKPRGAMDHVDEVEDGNDLHVATYVDSQQETDSQWFGLPGLHA